MKAFMKALKPDGTKDGASLAAIVTVAVAACVVFICFVPFTTLVWKSVTQPNQWSGHALSALNVLPLLSFEAWTRLLTNDNALLRAVLVSVGVSSVVAVCSTVIGFVASRAIARHPQRRLLMLAAYLPFAMSPVVYGACIHFFFILIGLSGSVFGVVVAQVMFGTAFAVMLFESFWNNEVQSLTDLARTLGADEHETLLRVLLPVARSFLALVLVQTFLMSWFQYGLTLVIGGGAVETLPLKVFAFVGEAHPTYAAVASLLLIAPALVLMVLNKNLVVRRLM
jgi:putative spermidine/putrescine transport system permease protein